MVFLTFFFLSFYMTFFSLGFYWVGGPFGHSQEFTAPRPRFGAWDTLWRASPNSGARRRETPPSWGLVCERRPDKNLPPCSASASSREGYAPD